MTHYKPEIVNKILDLLSCGKSIVDIEKIDGMPTRQCIFTWCCKYPDFYDAFDKAREFGAHAMAEQAADRIETCPSDPMELTKLRLYLEHMRWYIGKLNQRKYGEKTIISGDKDNPLTLNLAHTLDERIAARAARHTIEHTAKTLVIDSATE
jgi:hypothetical protein